MKKFKQVFIVFMSLTLAQFAFAQDSSTVSSEDQVTGRQQQQEAMPTNAEETYKDIKKTLGFVPEFMKKYPKEGITGAWIEMKQLEMGQTNIDAKNKQLLQLAVAGQVPCDYCVTFHTELAKAYGASEAEIAEAVALAGGVRSWSTVLNGLNIDQKQFQSEVNRLAEGIKKQGKMAE